MNRSALVLRLLGRITSIQVALSGTLFRSADAALPSSGWRSILVVRLDETIGDSVMFSPFLRELRRCAPDARITLVVHAGRADMYEHCPYVDDVVRSTLGSGAHPSLLFRPLQAARLVRREFGGRTFDAAFAPRVDYDHQAAFIVSASRAPIRIGFAEASTARKRVVSRGTDRLFTTVLQAQAHRHESDHALDMLGVAFERPSDARPEVWIGPHDHAAADAYLMRLGVDDFVVLAPSGGHSDLKQWPIARFDELARRLLESGRSVVFVGAPSDRELLAQIDDRVLDRAGDAVGRLTVRESAALIARATAFVGADSGMSHVAAAVGTSTIALFGPTCVHSFSPRGSHVEVLALDMPCGPCAPSAAPGIDRCATCIFPTPRCMSGITPNAVLERMAP